MTDDDDTMNEKEVHGKKIKVLLRTTTMTLNERARPFHLLLVCVQGVGTCAPQD